MVVMILAVVDTKPAISSLPIPTVIPASYAWTRPYRSCVSAFPSSVNVRMTILPSLSRRRLWTSPLSTSLAAVRLMVDGARGNAWASIVVVHSSTSRKSLRRAKSIWVRPWAATICAIPRATAFTSPVTRAPRFRGRCPATGFK